MKKAANAIAPIRQIGFAVSALTKSEIGSATNHRYGDTRIYLSLPTGQDDVVVPFPPRPLYREAYVRDELRKFSLTEQMVEPPIGCAVRLPPGDMNICRVPDQPEATLFHRPCADDEDAALSEDPPAF